jgi:hypothetical protein
MATSAKVLQGVKSPGWNGTTIMLPVLGFVLGLVACLCLIIVAFPKLLRAWAVSHLITLTQQDVEIDNISLSLVTGRLAISGLRILSKDNHSELVVIDRIDADVEVLRILRREVVLNQVEVMSPKIHLIRTVDSGWAMQFAGQLSSGDTPFITSIVVQRLELQDGTVILEDRSIAPPRAEDLRRIHLTLKDLSTTSSSPVTIDGSAQVFGEGRLVLKGSTLSDLRSGTLGIDLSGVALARIQAYLGNPAIMEGLIAAQLSVTWPGKGMAPVEIAGSVEGHDIALVSADHLSGRAVAITLSQVDILWPDQITVKRLVVTKPEIWIRRNASGRFVGVGASQNSGTRLLPARAQDTSPEDSTHSRQWSISKVVVRGGTVHLEDRSVTPMYADMLRNIEMSCDDLSSISHHGGNINARADIASGGALDIRGHVRLLDSGPTASLRAAIHQFVVPSTNPYLSRTISHYTTDGMLTSFMDIRLTGDRLEVRSDVTLSDLQIEPIRNSSYRTIQERIGLPLGLLIALLKDETGRIVITFPISGPLSNPSFDWTTALWTTIRNSVVKLISLPLRSIGRLFSNDAHVDELVLAPITFVPGSLAMPPATDRTLHEIARLMSSADRTILHITPILTSTDLDALQRLPLESWPVPNFDTAETARYLLAVRRAYLVAARVAGLKKVPATRLPVLSPQWDPSGAGMPRVELRLEHADGAVPLGRSVSRLHG